MTTSRPDTLIGRRAQFRISDIHYPDPAAVLDELHADDVLQGEVLDLSSSGLDAVLYVVVRVERLRQTLVVAVDRLLRCD